MTRPQSPSMFAQDAHGGFTVNPALRQVKSDKLARQVKERKMGRAKKKSDPVWFSAALEVVLSVARRQQFLNVDDVLEVFAPLASASGLSTPDNRALGPVMTSAAAKRYIESTECSDNSRRPEAHGKMIRRWRSLKYEGAA